MEILLKQKNEIVEKHWSGGCTKELFIFPPASAYECRNFQFRISSATVEQSPSAFTALPSFNRVLMPLSAPLSLCFNDQPAQTVKEFESIKFSGNDKTISQGVCTDVGIMFTSAFQAEIFSAQAQPFQISNGFLAVYALRNNQKILLNNKNYSLNSGDFFIASSTAQIQLSLASPAKNSAVIFKITPA